MANAIEMGFRAPATSTPMPAVIIKPMASVMPTAKTRWKDRSASQSIRKMKRAVTALLRAMPLVTVENSSSEIGTGQLSEGLPGILRAAKQPRHHGLPRWQVGQARAAPNRHDLDHTSQLIQLRPACKSSCHEKKLALRFFPVSRKFGQKPGLLYPEEGSLPGCPGLKAKAPLRGP